MTNEEYESERNKLIHVAVAFADSQVPAGVWTETKKNSWNVAFIREMDRLAVKAGLQSARFHINP